MEPAHQQQFFLLKDDGLYFDDGFYFEIENLLSSLLFFN